MQSKFEALTHTGLRIGRLLEVADYIAAQVGYFYCFSKSEDHQKPCRIATACVDNMSFYKPLSIEQDLRITGYPTFAGKSSIEV